MEPAGIYPFKSVELPYRYIKCCTLFVRCLECNFSVLTCSKSNIKLVKCNCNCDENIKIYFGRKKFTFQVKLLQSLVNSSFKLVCEFCKYESEDQQLLLHDIKCIFARGIIPSETQQCTICLTNKISICFLPCKHASCCAPCASKLKSCPICRSNINYFFNIILQE